MPVRTPIEFLSNEQIKTRAVVIEDADPAGIIQRQRILDQTVFDMLFIEELISPAQYEASIKLLADVGRSGADVRSANLDQEVFTPFNQTGSLIGERRMSFSYAFRKVVEACDDETGNLLMRTIGNSYKYPKKRRDRELLAAALSNALDSLVSHYGIQSARDPREIVRQKSF